MAASQSAARIALRTTRQSRFICQRTTSRTPTAISTAPSHIRTFPIINQSTRLFSSSAPRSSSTPKGSIGAGASGASSTLPPATLSTPSHLNEAERNIFEKLNAELAPTKLEVQDISGGCGSMYGIEVASERFRGLNTLKQQRLVNGILSEEIKGWHGVQLKTRVPE